jgi:hypothetical protein
VTAAAFKGAFMKEMLFDLLRRYLQGEIPLEELEDWEAAQFQFFSSLPVDDPAFHLWAVLQSRIFEVNQFHRTEEECRVLLQQALDEMCAVRSEEQAKPHDRRRSKASC